jgi:hypothetical protein
VKSSLSYYLLGRSFGGLVAHDIACSLQAQDQDVALLVLLDSYPQILWIEAPIMHEQDLIDEMAELVGFDPKDLKGKPIDIPTILATAREVGNVLGILRLTKLRVCCATAKILFASLQNFAHACTEAIC